jgi:flavin reductase (DIM6/NTAB) family NADH-FMN oxidoreductase RutF
MGTDRYRIVSVAAADGAGVMIFDFATLSLRDRHKLLTSTIVPRPIAWVSTLGLDGVANVAPFAFFNVFGEDPPASALGIHDGANGVSDTERNIRDTGEFVVNMVPPGALSQMVTARAFPPKVDGFTEAGLQKVPASRSNHPGSAKARRRSSAACCTRSS